VQARRAERIYSQQLSRLAKQIGQIITGYQPKDLNEASALNNMLRRYAEALTPWATKVATDMLTEVNARDIGAWRALGAELSKGVMRDIMLAPAGEAMRKLLDEQVLLIKSMPLDAALRVHDLTLKGLEDSTRASQIAKEIMRSGEVSKSKAMLIARTEVARTGSILTETRAKHIGSDGYIWQTSRDGDVRQSHKEMQGKLVKWSDPPTLDGMTGHAGCFPNCRCWAEVLLPD
jgi:SPP1 gp7 family putative phage head morphogenesis protein